MNKTKRRRLEAAGWKVGAAADFLGLSKEETAFVEMKLSLSRNLKKRRQAKRLTQSQVAKVIGSSQSRVAKMEAADPEVSIDLLLRSLLALGATRKQLAKIIGEPARRSAA
ncbi:MAG: helix-turn-helix transcriptional regulator [Planctomycetes bacterium]|nr:helix-turn-helix transcriptional regulator [Planctomycetota bacterium]